MIIRSVSNNHNSAQELRRVKWYTFITALYIAFLLLSIPLSPHSVEIFGTYQPAGIFIFPLSFIMLDVINATLRYEYARTAVYIQGDRTNRSKSHFRCYSSLNRLDLVCFEVSEHIKMWSKPTHSVALGLYRCNRLCYRLGIDFNNTPIIERVRTIWKYLSSFNKTISYKLGMYINRRPSQ